MKKRIIATLLSALLLASVTACNYVQKSNANNVEKSMVDEPTRDKSTFGHTLGDQANHTSIQLDQGQNWDDFINNNEYDAWLQNVLENDLLPLNEAYAQYLTLWKDEMTFTVQMAERLFENKSDYLSWKNTIEQWMQTTESLYQKEVQQLPDVLSRCEILNIYCKQIRQKVIDTKHFCYTFEVCRIWFDDVEKYASLRWSYEPATYYVETNFAKG